MTPIGPRCTCGSEGSRFDHALTHVIAFGRLRPNDAIAIGAIASFWRSRN
jgi:thiamine pyrophosphokinase